MTFTFTENLSDGVDFVRFHSGDTVEAEAILSDELIASLVTTYGQNRAVIQVIEYKILRLSQPDFKADWLEISIKEAVASLERRLASKRRELGVAAITASAKHVYRADSAQTEEPDYSEGRP